MATKKAVPKEISKYLAAIGSKGGRAKVDKGVSKMSEAKKKEIALLGVEARRKKAAAKKVTAKKNP